jgi:hypothetical protein
MSKWQSIVQVYNNDGTPHRQWPNPVGQSLPGGKSTARYRKLYPAFNERLNAQDCIIAFYIASDASFELLGVQWHDAVENPLTFLPEYINPSDADIIDTSEES